MATPEYIRLQRHLKFSPINCSIFKKISLCKGYCQLVTCLQIALYIYILQQSFKIQNAYFFQLSGQIWDREVKSLSQSHWKILCQCWNDICERYLSQLLSQLSYFCNNCIYYKHDHYGYLCVIAYRASGNQASNEIIWSVPKISWS